MVGSGSVLSGLDFRLLVNRSCLWLQSVAFHAVWLLVLLVFRPSVRSAQPCCVDGVGHVSITGGVSHYVVCDP